MTPLRTAIRAIDQELMMLHVHFAKLGHHLMKVLFDQEVPVPLRASFLAEVSTYFEMGRSSLLNGELLAQAEPELDGFITTDKNLRYQQDLAERKIAIFFAPYNPLAIAQSTCGCNW